VALREAARFASLAEADVACSALNACGLKAEVFDRNWGSNIWTNQVALGGIRLMVPDTQFEDADFYLREVRPSDPIALRWRSHPQFLRAIPLAFLAVVLGDWGGWALAVLLVRPTLLRSAVFAFYASTYAALVLASTLAVN
jgi:hypothetical protein